MALTLPVGQLLPVNPHPGLQLGKKQVANSGTFKRAVTEDGPVGAARTRKEGTAFFDPKSQTRVRFRQQFLKTRICKFWERNRCQRGSACDYAHGAVELAEPPNLERTAFCPKVDNCTDPDCKFAHDLTELRATGVFHKTAMCRLYRGGLCWMGESCRHAHDRSELGTKIMQRRAYTGGNDYGTELDSDFEEDEEEQQKGEGGVRPYRSDGWERTVTWSGSSKKGAGMQRQQSEAVPGLDLDSQLARQMTDPLGYIPEEPSWGPWHPFWRRTKDIEEIVDSQSQAFFSCQRRSFSTASTIVAPLASGQSTPESGSKSYNGGYGAFGADPPSPVRPKPVLVPKLLVADQDLQEGGILSVLGIAGEVVGTSHDIGVQLLVCADLLEERLKAALPQQYED